MYSDAIKRTVARHGSLPALAQLGHCTILYCNISSSYLNGLDISYIVASSEEYPANIDKSLNQLLL